MFDLSGGGKANEPGVCALLSRYLYGLRDAGMHFELTPDNGGARLCRRVVGQRVYRNATTNVRAYINGDNFVLRRHRGFLYEFFEQHKHHMWVKSECVLGPDKSEGDTNEVVFLTRVFR